LLKREIIVRWSMKKGVAVLVASAAAFVIGGCAVTPAVQQDACRLTEVPKGDLVMQMPFEIIDGRVFVQARVNERGPFRFAVDTGASGTARADKSLVSALGLTIHGQASTSDGVQTSNVDTTHLRSLELVGLVRQNLDVITRDYSGRKSPDAAFFGIVGRDFFADGLLIIDYPRKLLSFSRARGLSPTDKNVLTYERAFRVPVSIGALQTEGNLDTGANVTFVLPQALFDKVATAPAVQAGRGQLTNVEIETRRSTVRGPFQIGAATLADVDVRVSDRYPELLVGAHALQHFVLMIDQRSKSIALCH